MLVCLLLYPSIGVNSWWQCAVKLWSTEQETVQTKMFGTVSRIDMADRTWAFVHTIFPFFPVISLFFTKRWVFICKCHYM
jgi:hypothetical protein